jgi:hypothetical protein
LITQTCNTSEKELFSKLAPDKSLKLSPWTLLSLVHVVKSIETFGDGVWAQEQFCSVQNFETPSHHCGKSYGGLACKAWLVVQASLNFGEEQTMVNLGARP